jgi:hypothetical protein
MRAIAITAYVLIVVIAGLLAVSVAGAAEESKTVAMIAIQPHLPGQVIVWESEIEVALYDVTSGKLVKVEVLSVEDYPYNKPIMSASAGGYSK